MVSCLTLLGSTHALASKDGGMARTLCGLAIAESELPAGLFAEQASSATCQRCRDKQRINTASAANEARHWDAGDSIARLLERLNANDASGLESIAAGRLLESLSALRLNRLHQLFPAWRITADELIMDHSNAVLRYRVNFTDTCGLLGSPGPSAKPGQCVIFRSADNKLIEALPIVDDFAFWSSGSKPHGTGCLHCNPVPSSTEESRS